ncbi:MAG TPA: prepilin-type N-terminal cleavage/methylation domain-containing protein [Geoalkalibacter subterraneus]|uniref:Type II secretion system protein J n=1 Tax=Geoalkalibacter subterraneus TaxID=483547 RepID=A0A831LER8_9BACT|nr:prepilin-type N-terminal cleavage/methylation domain-containing protein [Geoalkalibacter subterraneus]
MWRSTVLSSAKALSDNRQRGFTLLEVLIALTVTAIVLTTVYGIFSGVVASKERLESDALAFHQARVLFDRMGREIRSFYASEEEGTFRGGENTQGRFFLELTTTVTSPSLPRATGFSRVRYEVRDDPEDRYALPELIREEQSLLPGADGEIMENRLFGGIRAFLMRFHDGREWQDEWTADQPSPPRMVELFLELEVDEVRQSFRTAFEIPRFEGNL